MMQQLIDEMKLADTWLKTDIAMVLAAANGNTIKFYSDLIYNACCSGVITPIPFSINYLDEPTERNLPFEPHTIFEWIKSKQLKLPSELISNFKHINPSTKKTSPVSLEKLIPLAQKLVKKTCGNSEDTVYKLFKHYTLQKHANIQAIKQIIDVLKEQYHEVNHDVALLIVNVIAQAKYSYDPTSRNNSATSNIARDVSLLELQIGDDTVRKALREGDRLISNLKIQN